METHQISVKELFSRIRFWYRFLLRKWYVIFIGGLLGGSIGFFIAKSKTPLYTATTTFVLEGAEQGGGLSQYAGIASMIGVDLGNGNEGIFQGDNLLELYKSRKMLEATLMLRSPSDSSLLLIDRYLKLYDKKKDSEISNLKNIDFKKDLGGRFQRAKDSILQKAVANINKNILTVGKLDKKLSIIKIDIKSPDEIFSKEFNECLVKQVNEFYLTTKTKKSLGNIAILQHKTDSVRSVMNNNIGTMARVMDVTPNLNPTRLAQRTIPTQQSQISAETNKAILSQLVQNLELTKMSLMKEAPLIEVLDEPRYPLNKETYSALTYLIIGGSVSAIILIFLLSVSWWIIKFN